MKALKQFLIFIAACCVTFGKINAQVSGTICAGNSAILTNTTQGLASITQSISPGGSTDTGAVVSFTVSPLVTTVYTVFANGLDATNTPTTHISTFSITVNPQPTVATTYSLSTCTSTTSAFNMHLSFIPPTAVPNYTVYWMSIPNGITTNTQISASGVLVGTYPITITAQGGCALTTVITIPAQPTPASFTVSPIGTNIYSITCTQPTINISATNANLTYSWSNVNTGVINGTVVTANATTLGTWTVTGQNPSSGCVTAKIFSVVLSTASPTSAVTPILQQLTCSNPQLQPVILTALSPSVNVLHYIIDDVGQTFFFTGPVGIFQPSTSTHTYTYILVNAATGCSATPKNFTVIASTNSPTFNMSSTGTLQGQGNYTVGCNNHSLTVLNIVTPNTNPIMGGALQFGYLQPGSTSTVPAYIGFQSTVVSTPGTWTLVVRDIGGNCETRVPVIIIQNIIAPNISAMVPTQVLNCTTPSVILTAQSTNSAVTFNWFTPLGFIPSQTVIAATTTNSTSTSVGNYTLSITDQDNGCVSNSVIPMQQNLFPPHANIVTTNHTLTCISPTIQLSNASTTGIPPNSGFPTSGIIQAILWDGPVPQPTIALFNSYVAGTSGQYSLTVKDSNNGCVSITTTVIWDGRVYPFINPGPFCLITGEQATITAIISSSPLYQYQYTWYYPSNANISGQSTGTLITDVIGTYSVAVINSVNGCTESGAMAVIQCYVGLNTLTSDRRSIAIYPNPVNEMLSFEWLATSGVSQSEIENVTIHDILGNGIKSEALQIKNGKAEINVNELKSGIYFIQIGNRTQKFVKE